MAGVQNASRLDHHQFRFRLRRRSVLYTTRHDIQLTRLHIHAALWQIDTQGAFKHQERFQSRRRSVTKRYGLVP